MEDKAEKQWIENQVVQYEKLRDRFVKYSEKLNKILSSYAKKVTPEAIVQVRAKAISSFAEKIQRKRSEYTDAIKDITDLCGGRVILTTPSEVEEVCQFIEEHFVIDWENSIDVSERHKPAEFGYRSVHYIISFKEGVFPTKNVNVSIPKYLFPFKKCPMKAEIQVRTLLEHAWAVFTHDRVYKSSFTIPYKLEREMNAIAAVLETADQDFDRILNKLRQYASDYTAYMTREEIIEEIIKLEFVLSKDERNVEIACRIAQLAISMDNWQKAIDTLDVFASSENQQVLKLLGFALTKKHKKSPGSRNFKQGRGLLETSIKIDEEDADVMASLAGTYKGIDEKKARDLYLRAYEIDPSDPYPLENFLSYEIADKKDISIISMMSPILKTSIQRCIQQIEAGVNIPWAYYSMGRFYLLLNQPYESFSAYCRAIQLSTAEFMITTSLVSLEGLDVIKKKLIGYEWIRRLLIISLASRYPEKGSIIRLRKLKTKNSYKIKGPVIIVCGGCDASIENKLQEYRKILIDTFKYFSGTIVSGGTTQGICSLVGDIKEQYMDTIHTIGYIPKFVPADATVDKDPLRYEEIRYTDGSNFSPLEPIQNWIDLICSGITPQDVKIIGINGGKISSAEYKMALAMGAKVALIEKSGGEAAKMLDNPNWQGAEGLLQMPCDTESIREFIRTPQIKLPPKKREAIAKAFFYVHQQSQLDEWGNQKENMKDSNYQAADHIIRKLDDLGYEVRETKNKNIKPRSFSKEEIEILAEKEHGRWNVERLLDGWKWGEKKDVDKKISPYIVSWKELLDDARQWDRNLMTEIPEILASEGYEIIKKENN